MSHDIELPVHALKWSGDIGLAPEKWFVLVLWFGHA